MKKHTQKGGKVTQEIVSHRRRTASFKVPGQGAQPAQPHRNHKENEPQVDPEADKAVVHPLLQMFLLGMVGLGIVLALQMENDRPPEGRVDHLKTPHPGAEKGMRLDHLPCGQPGRQPEGHRGRAFKGVIKHQRHGHGSRRGERHKSLDEFRAIQLRKEIEINGRENAAGNTETYPGALGIRGIKAQKIQENERQQIDRPVFHILRDGYRQEEHQEISEKIGIAVGGKNALGEGPAPDERIYSGPGLFRREHAGIKKLDKSVQDRDIGGYNENFGQAIDGALVKFPDYNERNRHIADVTDKIIRAGPFVRSVAEREDSISEVCEERRQEHEVFFSERFAAFKHEQRNP